MALGGKAYSLVRGATFKLAEYTKDAGEYYGLTEGTTVTFFTKVGAAIRQMNIYHEVGHLINNMPGSIDVFSNALTDATDRSFVGDNGYIVAEALIAHPNVFTDPNYSSVQAIQASEDGDVEAWADAFANYVAGNIDLSKPTGPGVSMYNFVTNVLAPYIDPP